MCAQSYPSRLAPAVRGFKPDIIGTALLVLFLLVGRLLITAMFWNVTAYIELVEALGLTDGIEVYDLVGLSIGLCQAGNAAAGFALFILAFGVKGRKLVSMVPMLLFLSPFLYVFLDEPFANVVGFNLWSHHLFWFVTYGVFYAAALAAWAYGFGRSVAGVVAAALLGATALVGYRFVMSEWVGEWLFDLLPGAHASDYVSLINSIGFGLVVALVIALSCLIGPGLARQPIADGSSYAPRPVAQTVAGQPGYEQSHHEQRQYGQPTHEQRPAVTSRYVVSALTWGPSGPTQSSRAGDAPQGGPAWSVGQDGRGVGGGSSR